MKIYDVIILGAGASGLMCASHLNKNLSVAIIEGNSKIAQKLKVSGGGKCNITNVSVSPDNFDGDTTLVDNVLQQYSKEDLLKFLEDNSLEPVIRKNRYYFCKNSSDEIINILKKLTAHQKLFLDTTIIDLTKKDEIFEINTTKGLMKAKTIVVATGGKSFKNLGASDIGLKIAKNFNLDIEEFSPALVGLTVQKDQFWMKELSGLSCYVHIKVEDKVLKEEMLFAHKGISGPATLSASLYWRKGNISIDFLPDKDILNLIRGSKKLISTVIPLPKRLSLSILKAIDVKDIECKKLSHEEKEKLSNIHNYSFAPAGNFGFSKAEVSRGGVKSFNENNLYFTGEVVDVTGELGGYNFQWAFSSAVICARIINKQQ